ncbi:MAG: hypothetical protein K0M48_08825 [Thiobacillus sp.]|nr:hypothetical protein [Thiobacillus sp.]
MARPDPNGCYGSCQKVLYRRIAPAAFFPRFTFIHKANFGQTGRIRGAVFETVITPVHPDYAITRNIRVALDYTHVDLGSDTQTKDWYTLAGAYGGRETFRLDAKADVTALRLNYAF